MANVPRTNLSEVLAIPDPLYSDNFELYFPVLPTDNGRSVGVGPAVTGLRVQCKTATIPGIMNEAQDITIHGFKIGTAGRTVFSNTMSVTYMESNTLIIQRTLRNWVNMVRDFRDQISIGKQQYAKAGELIVYNELGRKITSYALVNCFCTEVQDISMDGNSANIIEVNATFRYDFADESSSSTGKSII
jgi:hypothetical protein